MNVFKFVVLFIVYSTCEGAVTEIRSTSEDEAVVESVTEDAWMPSNIFDVKPESKLLIKEKVKEARNEIPEINEAWDDDSSPLLKAIRDFLFAGGDDDLSEETEHNDDPTEEIVKILEKGLIEATTMLFNTDADESTVTSEVPLTDQISITKIDNEASDTFFDRIGINNLINVGTSDGIQGLSVTNATNACSTCYETLHTCVQQCFANHNCHDVQRQARMCPPTMSRMCNIFTQWSPVDECQEHEDCKSPLLCCSDGCVNKCVAGVWRD